MKHSPKNNQPVQGLQLHPEQLSTDSTKIHPPRHAMRPKVLPRLLRMLSPLIAIVVLLTLLVVLHYWLLSLLLTEPGGVEKLLFFAVFMSSAAWLSVILNLTSMFRTIWREHYSDEC